jgi:hypothetical protein
MDLPHDEYVAWADEQFGHALLGDRRRTQRLVAMAAGVARRPAGTVTAVFSDGAEREGAFRLLESPQVNADAVSQAMHVATARRCATEPYVFVPLDGSSLTLGDRAKKRELGRVGSHASTRGLLVMSAMAVDRWGVVLGLLDQRWWAREKAPPAKKKNPKKSCRVPLQQKETRHWVDALGAVQQVMATEAPGVRPWFQLDRGADCWPVFTTAIERKLLLTVRATFNRRLTSESGRRAYLRDELQRQPLLDHYDLELPATPKRPARTARIAVRACTVTLDLRVSRKRHAFVTMHAVLAEECNRTSNDRLQWMLLTTHPVTTFDQALKVIDGYTYRWRIEEFHRAWKSGVCNVEDTQLQSRAAILKWATLLAAVASRAVRLAYLVRTSPEAPASDEFTPDEIDAAFLLAKRKRDLRKRVLLHEMIALVGELGGFAHTYSRRLPGPQILARGLLRIEPLAEGLKNMREM